MRSLLERLWDLVGVNGVRVTTHSYRKFRPLYTLGCASCWEQGEPTEEGLEKRRSYMGLRDHLCRLGVPAKMPDNHMAFEVSMPRGERFVIGFSDWNLIVGVGLCPFDGLPDPAIETTVNIGNWEFDAFVTDDGNLGFTVYQYGKSGATIDDDTQAVDVFVNSKDLSIHSA